MSAADAPTGLAQDLAAVTTELETALRQAAESVRRLREISPRVDALAGSFAQLDALISAGRRQLGSSDAAPAPPLSRPVLVVPGAIPPASAHDRSTAPASAHDRSTEAPHADGNAGDSLPPTDGAVSFRLEFESKAGPLDLRAVDDAISRHPAVRDVALLDYDGHKATLKVWINRDAKPADVQRSLSDDAAALFPGHAQALSIVALEDVA